MKKFPFVFITLFLPCNVFAQESSTEANSQKSPWLFRSQLRLENVNEDRYENNDEIYSELKANLYSNLMYKKKWFGEIGVRYEKNPSLIPTERDYGGESAYLREMRFGYNSDNYLFYAGKFRPSFGIAWRNGRNNWYDFTQNDFEQFDYNNTRGIASDYVAQNYAQTEKLGFGGAIKAGNEKTVGKYELGLSVFTNDRKNFDNSVINSRVSATKGDALPGDTRSLASYVASLDVSYDFGRYEKLFYRFAYINLAVNSNALAASETADQTGYSAAINYQYPFSSDFNLNALAEFVKMRAVAGNPNFEDNYLNASLVGNILHNWNVTFAYGGKRGKQVEPIGRDVDMTEISGGYRFDKTAFFDSLLLQIGYRNLRSNFDDYSNVTNSASILARYIKNF